MPEETPSTQPEPKPEPKKEETPKKGTAPKKKGGWFQKIPPEILLSPGGFILIFLASLIEIVDWIPLPPVDQLIELPLEIIFIVLLAIIAKIPLKSLIIPFVIERIPIISDILPTWLLKLFI